MHRESSFEKSGHNVSRMSSHSTADAHNTSTYGEPLGKKKHPRKGGHTYDLRNRRNSKGTVQGKELAMHKSMVKFGL